MRILVFGHRLDVGGTQVNAIELSTYLRDIRGHEITYFATPGPMRELVEKAGLRFLPAPEANSHPSPSRMRAIDQILRSERPDVVHVWDWPQWLDAFVGLQLYRRTPLGRNLYVHGRPKRSPEANSHNLWDASTRRESTLFRL